MQNVNFIMMPIVSLMVLLVCRDQNNVLILKEMMKPVLNSLLLMGHVKQVHFQIQLLHVHQEFVLKHLTPLLLIKNAKIIILHAKQMEEDVKLLSFVVNIKLSLHVQSILHVYGLIPVDLKLKIVLHLLLKVKVFVQTIQPKNVLGRIRIY